MKKIFLLFLLFVVLFIGSFFNSSTAELKSNSFGIESLNKNLESVYMANELTDIFYKEFNSNVNSWFAGFYVDKLDELNLSIVRNTVDPIWTIENYKSTHQKISNYTFDYITVKYTMEQLIIIKNYIDKFLFQFVDCASINIENNHIEISLIDQKNETNFIDNLVENNTFFEANMISFVSNQKIELTNSIKAGEGIYYKEKIIFFWITKWYGTIGFNAIDSNGKKGIVTNEHVAPLGYQMMTSENDIIGTSTIAVNNSTTDAAFVKFEDQINWVNTPYIYSNDPSFYISRTSLAVQGARVWSVGKKTGSLYGYITSINASGTVGDVYMTDLIQHDCIIDHGDSGGPLITWSNRLSNQGIYGINFGVGISRAYTIKIENVLDDLNVEIAY